MKRFANVQIYNMLIDGHCMRGNIGDAFKVLDEMLRSGISPTIVTYNALVNGLSKKGRVAEAEELAFSVTDKGLNPDVITYNSLICGFSDAGNLEKCLNCMRDENIRPTLSPYHPLISVCKKDGLDLLEKIVKEMSHWNLTPDRILDYGALERGNVQGARDLFDDMMAKGLAPSDGIFNTLIEGHCKLKDFEGAYMWYKEMLKIGFLPCISVCNELLSGLRAEGRFQEAEIICSEMSIKGVDDLRLQDDLSAARAM
ncbi:UNVERIFIED_CONTAM: Pentatricopeptide repeat-containing protein, mitochondrial [Sesamum angustifolium]|uniref:Pentatricopeptide repeat-containing protein, mitochondrial n=1 Tax=Sesamum angustifolium TaxID=2727405 RepID=A0AAW2N556_9LAMI